MKTLFITEEGHKQKLDSLYLSFHKAVGSCDFRDLTEEYRNDLKWYFHTFVNINRFDRIILHLGFEELSPQLKFLKLIPNLVLIDFEANEKSALSESYGRNYLKFLRQLPWARVIVSSFTFAKRLRDAGFDAWGLPKGYDDSKFVDYGLDRQVLTGFIGSKDSSSFMIRQSLLEDVAKIFPSFYHGQTLDNSEFVMKLNQIKYFINPDKNLNEYTYRYFEAMASGAVIVGVSQGVEENESLGFENMKNIVFADTAEAFVEKIAYLENNPDVYKKINEEAKLLVQSKYSFDKIGLNLFLLIDMSLREPKEYESALSIFGYRF